MPHPTSDLRHAPVTSDQCCGVRRAAHRSLVRVCVCVRVCMHTPPESPAARGPIPTPCPAAGPAAIRVACCCSEARRPAPLLPLRCSAPPCDPCTPTSTSIPGNDLRDVGRSRRRGKRVHAKLPVSGASSERSLDGRARYTSPARLFDIRFELLKARLRTLTWPPSSAPYELGEATTWKLSVAYRLGVTKRAYGACSDSTWSIFRWFYQIVKLAAHAQKVQFGL